MLKEAVKVLGKKASFIRQAMNEDREWEVAGS